MISEKKSRKACKILVISIFTELPCSSSASSIPIVLQYLNNRNTNKHETLHLYVFYSGNVHNFVIFSLTFTFCVTDRYQHKQCIIMETETETNMKICMYRDFIGSVCNRLLYTLVYRPLSALPIKRPW